MRTKFEKKAFCIAGAGVPVRHFLPEFLQTIDCTATLKLPLKSRFSIYFGAFSNFYFFTVFY